MEEAGELVGKHCEACFQWFQLNSKRKFHRHWGCAWPSYVARALLHECAPSVWTVLPVEIRRQWRLLRVCIPPEVLLPEHVQLVHNEDMVIHKLMTMAHFHRLANEDFDCK